MSYLKKYQWELVPESLPKVKRSCPKCNEKTIYINSEKFRVNANKNKIDIWLIYQCIKCKSTWNMAIYERVKPYEINKYEYEKFLSNDKELAKKYAFDLNLYHKNKAEIILEDIRYKLIEKELEAYNLKENELVIEIIYRYPIELRIDRLLSDKIGLSRSKIKNMHKKGKFFINDNKNLLNSKIKNGIELHFLNISYKMDDLKIMEY